MHVCLSCTRPEIFFLPPLREGGSLAERIYCMPVPLSRTESPDLLFSWILALENIVCTTPFASVAMEAFWGPGSALTNHNGALLSISIDSSLSRIQRLPAIFLLRAMISASNEKSYMSFLPRELEV